MLEMKEGDINPDRCKGHGPQGVEADSKNTCVGW